FIHRTFNGPDLRYFIQALKHIYLHETRLEGAIVKHSKPHPLQPTFHQFKNLSFELPHETRTEKHISDPLKKSAAKRINMFLRWMIRNDNSEVDFGIWKQLSPSQLSCPLDVHSGNVARKLGLLHRKQNDAIALQELDSALRTMDP